MTIINIRNNREATIQNESTSQGNVVLQFNDNGEIKEVTRATFKRWYKVVENTNTQNKEETKMARRNNTNKPADEATPEVNENVVEQGETTPEGETPEKKTAKKGRNKVAGDCELKFVIENLAKDKGCEIFEGKVTGFRSIKVDGHMCMAFTFNTKGITLWLRADAVKDLGLNTKTINHMFNARIMLQENNAENIDIIDKAMTASIEFQTAKKASTKKAQAEAKRAEKQASKAATADTAAEETEGNETADEGAEA